MSAESRERDETTEPKEDAAERPRAARAPFEAVLRRSIAKLCAWWLGAARPPRDRLEAVVRHAVPFLALVAALVVAARITKPARTAKTPTLPAVGAEPSGVAFGLSDDLRRQIFQEMAAAELDARKSSAGMFGGHVWSIEDQRASLERYAAHRVAAKHKISLTQVYLVVDEGIRNRWPGPDGKPLPATTPPLDPRKQ